MPPGRNMDDLLTLLVSGMWRLHYKLSREGRARFFSEFLPLLHETKHAVLGPRDDNSYYLVYIGTRPAARGMGLARKCVDHVTAMADREGRACYLESSNDVNLIIYGKMGFGLVRQISLTRAEENVVLDIMVREPMAVKAGTEAAGSRESNNGVNSIVERVTVEIDLIALSSARIASEPAPENTLKTYAAVEKGDIAG